MASSSQIAYAIKDMNARLGLPNGLAAMGIGHDVFGKVISGAIADHCHLTNPKLASAEDYAALLEESL